MFITAGRRAKSIRCIAAALILAVWPLHAATPQEIEEASIAVDQSIQALKDEVVLFQRDAVVAEDQYLYPPISRVSVFVSVGVPGLLLDEFSVSMPGMQPVVYRYDDLTARALLQKSTAQQLLRINLPAGQHRLNARFSGRMATADDDDEPLTGEGQFTFRKEAQATELELRIVRGARRRSEPGLQLREWRAVD